MMIRSHLSLESAAEMNFSGESEHADQALVYSARRIWYRLLSEVQRGDRLIDGRTAEPVWAGLFGGYQSSVPVHDRARVTDRGVRSQRVGQQTGPAEFQN